MPLPELLDELKRGAEAEREAVLGDARARAERIRGESTARLNREQADRLAPRERELKATNARTLAEARRRGRATALAARQRVFERVFARARERLAALASDEAYRNAIPSHLGEALVYMGDVPVVIRCPPALAGAVRAALEGRADAQIAEDETMGPGVVVQAADGHVVVDNTLEARLTRLRPVLSVELARELEAIP